MNDKFLDEFLKKNAPIPPAAPHGEKNRIWAQIEALEAPWWSRLFSLPQIKIAVPIMTALAVALIVAHQKQARRNAEVERVLLSALQYQIDDEEDSPF